MEINWTLILSRAITGFFGPLVTAAVAVIVVILSNRAQLKKTDRELQAAAAQSELDRRIDIRRDVFLTAFESTNLYVQSLVRAADPHLPWDKLNLATPEKLAQASRINLVASDQTIERLADLMGQVGVLLQKLEPLRGWLRDMHKHLEGFEKLIENSSRERQRMIDLHRELRRTGQIKEEHREDLRKQFDEAMRNEDRWRGEIEKLSDTMAPERTKLQLECFLAARSVVPAVASVLNSLRTELGLAFNSYSFVVTMERQWDRIILNFSKSHGLGLPPRSTLSPEPTQGESGGS